MSELANNLLDAIASDDKEQIASAFNDVMNSKINDNLQARKIELAQRIYGNAIQSAETNDDASDSNTETVASEHGSEEV